MSCGGRFRDSRPMLRDLEANEALHVTSALWLRGLRPRDLLERSQVSLGVSWPPSS